MEIVVGVAGDRSDAAVRWAAQESVLTDVPLVLWHTYTVPSMPSVVGALATPQMQLDALASAEGVLARARRVAEALMPVGATITTQVAHGKVVELLPARAHGAHVLVLGSHEDHLRLRRVGATAAACLHGAGCPVLIVPPDDVIAVRVPVAATAAHR